MERIDSQEATEQILFVVEAVFRLQVDKSRKHLLPAWNLLRNSQIDTTGFDVAVSVGGGFAVARRKGQDQFCVCEIDGVSEYGSGYAWLQGVDEEQVPEQFDHLVFHNLDEWNNDHPVLQDADLHTCIKLACTMVFEKNLDEAIIQLTEDAAAEAEKEDAEYRRDAR